MKTKPLTLSLELSPKALIFKRSLDAQHEYVVLTCDMDYLDFMKKYPNGKRAEPVELDETWDEFWLVYLADCFDPPLAIVRAKNEQDAEEAFVDNLDWAHVKEPDLADYDEDSLSFGPHGQPYDGSQIHVEQVILVGVEL